MRGILRLGLMMLLVAAAGVGIARGEWKEYTPSTPGAITWQYEKIAGTNTCSIQIPESNRSSISGSVTIPSEVKEGSLTLTVVVIATSAFENCSRLTAVDIPNSVTKIGFGAFSGCKRMTAVKIPNGVKQIETIVFSNCSSLTEITIPSSVATIDASAFLGCSGLKNFKVDESNASYCAVAGVLFTKTKDKLICCPKGMKGEYVIPNGVTKIGWYAFADCKKLSAVTIPSSVTTISGCAFSGCSGLTEVPIPSSVKTIGSFAFSYCKWLKEFKVEQGNERYDVADGVLFTKDMQALIAYPGGRKGAYEIPGSVTGIGVGAFSGCDGLTEVTIPDGVTAIEVGAFSGCDGLTEVTIPDGVTYIKEYAFEVCKNLTEVTIPDGVTNIEQSAFAKCSKLNKVYWLAGSGEKVSNRAFEGIGNSATLYVRKGEEAKIKGNGKTWWNKFTIVECYLVAFNAKGGTPTPDAQMVQPNGTATEPTAPTKTGYTFVEWQLKGAKYDFSTKVTKDITLVAVWKKNEASTPSTPKDPKDSETAVESVQLAAVRVVRNPVGEALELEGMERAARVEVYSVVGARVHAEALHGEPRVTIDARGWVHGVYVVRVAASDGERTLRVVK